MCSARGCQVCHASDLNGLVTNCWNCRPRTGHKNRDRGRRVTHAFEIYYCCILFLWNWSCYAWSIFLWVLFSCLDGPHIFSYCFIVSSLSSELCHCVQSTISLWIQWIHCCWNMLEQSTAGRYVCAVGVVPKDMEVGSGMPLLIFMVFHTAAF